ncbi:hypothetical protein GP486_004542 [Trichoglossum hirsutum]|uniref:Uncharacterized protein n=1 Tax=Trichoglossum hirsutum TaxID=265104 RepID=A0A9P8LAV3_9PEZI|nr:hypothetical protein GP486_004542 [Trichoglossum hirsutum]
MDSMPSSSIGQVQVRKASYGSHQNSPIADPHTRNGLNELFGQTAGSTNEGRCEWIASADSDSTTVLKPPAAHESGPRDFGSSDIRVASDGDTTMQSPPGWTAFESPARDKRAQEPNWGGSGDD